MPLSTCVAMAYRSIRVVLGRPVELPEVLGYRSVYVLPDLGKEKETGPE